MMTTAGTPSQASDVAATPPTIKAWTAQQPNRAAIPRGAAPRCGLDGRRRPADARAAASYADCFEEVSRADEVVAERRSHGQHRRFESRSATGRAMRIAAAGVVRRVGDVAPRVPGDLGDLVNGQHRARPVLATKPVLEVVEGAEQVGAGAEIIEEMLAAIPRFRAP